MSPKFKELIVTVMIDALHEINEILGYEYFKRDMIEQTSKNFLLVVPVAEELVKEIRGVNLDEIEKEQYDYSRLKRYVLRGLFDGYILRDYSGNSFDEKFKKYLYNSGIERCTWIAKTRYDNYYQVLNTYVSKLNLNENAKSLVKEFIKEHIKSTTQTIAKMLTKKKFFEDNPKIDEIVIDEI
jgi:6-phosphofructokinase